MCRRRNFHRNFVIIFATCIFSSFVSKSEAKENKLDADANVIGIDLGTTYSCVAIFKDGRVKIIANDQGNRITASVVAFTNKGERLVGDVAKIQLTSNPKNTIFDAKRLIGRKWNDPSLQSDIRNYPFKVINKRGKPNVELTLAGSKKVLTFTPEEISAMVLGKMKEMAEVYLGKPVKYAVVTVPAFFNDAQRATTKDAGAIAGLTVLQIINEPNAAAIAYGLDKKDLKKILVFDLGGGTFDVSLLIINHGVFEVLATNGNTHLGGEDFNHRVTEHFINVFKEKHKKDLRDDPRAVQKLRREVEKAKRELSSQQQTRLETESIYAGIDLSETLTRIKFEELNMDLFLSTMETIEKVLKDAEMKKSEVDEVVLVGGSTRIPKIQQLVKTFFGGKEPFRGINPDEAVAYGAAVQAAKFIGEGGDMVLLDVNPLTLGVEVVGGLMYTLISRNNIIPNRSSRTFTTTEDKQTAVDIRIFEGERSKSKDNNELGSFRLNGIRPAPRGRPIIEVTFKIDDNGILHVSAEEKGSGKMEEITITNNQNRLTPEQIKLMVKKAEEFAETDKLTKERIEARNDLDMYAYTIMNQIQNEFKLGEGLAEEDKNAAEEEVKEVITWLEKNQEASVGEFVERKKNLELVMQGINRELHAESSRRIQKNDTETRPWRDEL